MGDTKPPKDSQGGSEQPRRLREGDEVGNYLVLAHLFTGGMGDIYAAVHLQLNRHVALKVPRVDTPSADFNRRRLLAEARFLARVTHGNVVGVYDFSATNDRLEYLVMELLDGRSLDAILGTSPMLQISHAIRIVKEMARGLAAFHRAGIYHVDLKPENVMVVTGPLVNKPIDGENWVKLIDLGTARLTYELTVDAELPTVGTPAYMAPEAILDRTVDGRADLHALGIVFYEILAGRHPLAGIDDADMLQAHVDRRALPISAYRPEIQAGGALETLIGDCLEKRPEERFQSARDLAFDLEILAASSGMPSGTAERPIAGRLRRRVSLPVAVAVVVFGTILGALAAGLYFDRAVSDEIRIQRLTYRRGWVWSARFAPEAGSIIYGAAWEGTPLELYMARIDSVDSRPLGLGAADVLAISDGGEMALSLDRRFTAGWETSGTLATSSLVGLAPREVLEGVSDADWGPDGESLAVVREVGGRFRLEYPVGKVLYETDGWLSNVRVRPRGDLVAFVDHPLRGDNLGSVSVVDLEGERTILNVGGSQGLAWSPSGDEVWSSSGGRLFALTLSGERRTVYTSTGTMWLQDISTDGKVLFAGADMRREMVGRAPGDAAERNLSWFDWSAPQALSVDGNKVLFDEQNIGGANGYFVYVRGTDGSPPIMIGEGTGRALSPDGRWALSVSRPFGEPKWVLLPTGPGEGRELPAGSVRNMLWARWLPDGNRLLVAGSEPGKALGLYVRGLDSADERLVTPDGVDYARSGYAVSPDGRWVAVKPIDGPQRLYPLEGGDSRVLPGLEDSELPVQWTADGSALYVYRAGEVPARVSLVTVGDGKRSPWRDLAPSDTAGVFGIDFLAVTMDGTGYVYSYRRLLSTLYVVEGLR